MADFPTHAQKGSNGEVFNHLGAFLLGKVGNPEGMKFDPDGKYGDTLAAMLKLYQRASGIEVDGHCGPQTQATLFHDGFNFKRFASISYSTNMFLQPDGRSEYWPVRTGR